MGCLPCVGCMDAAKTSGEVIWGVALFPGQLGKNEEGTSADSA